MNIDSYYFQPDKKLADYDTNVDLGKTNELEKDLQDKVEKLSELQEKLFAQARQSLLIVFQGMDAAGKDSAIKSIFSGVNPQGVRVTSFKTPSKEEYSHDYLWRHVKALPAKGMIGVFNRSHYENVLVCKVHPEYILSENLEGIHSVKDITPAFFQKRYLQINQFENYLINNNTHIIKFMLHISQDEQEKRFYDRLKDDQKNWKFSAGDFEESQLWDPYQNAYQDMLKATSTASSPWYVIPCDDKPTSRLIMAEIIEKKLTEINPQFPELSDVEVQKNLELYHKLTAKMASKN